MNCDSGYIIENRANPDLPIAVILGSTRPGRMNPVVARWFLGLLEAHGDFQVDVIDPAANRTGDLTGRLTRAEGFVIVTPEYNHSFPAPLKELIDAHAAPWMAKPVAFVSYGGVSGGLRAIEHLRGVLAELHAVTLRDSVSLHLAWQLLDDTGELKPEPAAEAAVKVLLDRLVWWTVALSAARTQNPYAAQPHPARRRCRPYAPPPVLPK